MKKSSRIQDSTRKQQAIKDKLQAYFVKQKPRRQEMTPQRLTNSQNSEPNMSQASPCHGSPVSPNIKHDQYSSQDPKSFVHFDIKQGVKRMIRMASLSSSPPPEKSAGSRKTIRQSRSKPRMTRQELQSQEQIPRQRPKQHPLPMHPSSSPHHTPLRSMTNIGKIIRLSSLDQKKHDLGDTTSSYLMREALLTPNDFKLQPGKITKINSSRPSGISYNSNQQNENIEQFHQSSSIKLPLMKNSWKKQYISSFNKIMPISSVQLANGEYLSDNFLRYPLKFLTLSKQQAHRLGKKDRSSEIIIAKKQFQKRYVKPIQKAEQFGKSTVFNPIMHQEFINRLQKKNSERIYLINLISKEEVVPYLMQIIDQVQGIKELSRENS